jgi:hypothetical protein
MSMQQESSTITLIAGEALEIYRRIRINSSGQAVYAAAGEVAEGVTQSAAASAGTVLVKLINGTGTFRVTASAAITVGTLLYGTAAGKVDDAGLGVAQFRALEASTADNAQIMAARIDAAPTNIFASTFTITATEAALNSNNGQVDFQTGFGAAPAGAVAQVRTVTIGRVKSTFDVTFPTGGDLGKVRVAGVAAGTQLDTGDIVDVIAWRNLGS